MFVCLGENVSHERASRESLVGGLPASSHCELLRRYSREPESSSDSIRSVCMGRLKLTARSISRSTCGEALASAEVSSGYRLSQAGAGALESTDTTVPQSLGRAPAVWWVTPAGGVPGGPARRAAAGTVSGRSW